MRIANAPCSWGATDDFPAHKDAPGYARVLDEMVLAGYEGTELGDWGFLPNDASRVRDELSKRSLALVGAFVPVRLIDADAHAAGEELARKTARLLADASRDGDAPVLVLADEANARRGAVAGRVTATDSLTPDQHRTAANGVNRIARAVHDSAGLRTAFHHHAGTHIETPDELAKLMEMTDADLVGLCLDTGHYAYGGGDPAEAVRRFGERISHVHAKDCDRDLLNRARHDGWHYSRAVNARLFCELGRGVVDLPGVFAELKRRNYEGWVVVEDEVAPGTGIPLESARRDRGYLRGLGF